MTCGSFADLQLHEIHNRIRPQDIELLRRDYAANGGWETFLSYEDPEADILVGLLRLRKCSEDGTFRKELVGMDGGCSLVRELHVYGTAAPVHSRDPKKFQHQVREASCIRATSRLHPGHRHTAHGGGGADRS